MLRLNVKLEHPQPRHIQRAVDILRGGGIAIYPTDTTYGLGCDLYLKRSVDRIYQLKGLERSHPLSFLCADLSQVSEYAVVEDRAYRILRHHVPGPYTFILPATRTVPKLLQSTSRTVGVRIPASPTAVALIEQLGHPLISTTVSRRDGGALRSAESADDGHMNDPDDIAAAFGRSVEVLLDGGPLYGEPSSVIDLCGEQPSIVRAGSGDLSWLR